MRQNTRVQMSDSGNKTYSIHESATYSATFKAPYSPLSFWRIFSRSFSSSFLSEPSDVQCCV